MVERGMTAMYQVRYPGQPRDEIGRFAETGSAGSKAPVNEDHHAKVLDAYGPELDRLAAKHGMTRAEYTAAANARMKELTSTAQVRVRMTPFALLRMLEDGRFKSQFESGASKGYLDPEFRSTAEQEYFGYPKDMPAGQRPIYGYAASTQLGDQEPYLDMYGSAVVWLKDSVQDRTSVTWCDSLSDGAQPMPLMAPDVTAISASLLEPGIHYSVTFVPDSQDLIKDPLEWRTLEDGRRGYVEAQIHGGVSIDDVAAVEWAPFGYETAPPNTADQILNAEGIPHRHRTYDPAAPEEPWINGAPERILPVKQPEPYQQWPSQLRSRVVDAHGNVHDEHTGEFTTKGGSAKESREDRWTRENAIFDEALLYKEEGADEALAAWANGTGFVAIRSAAAGDPDASPRAKQYAQEIAAGVLEVGMAERPSGNIYRGLAVSAKDGIRFAALVPGETVDLNLSSWSGDERFAHDFANQPGPGSTGSVPVVLKASGVRGLHIGGDNGADEWITDGRFSILSVDRVGGGYEITMAQEMLFAAPRLVGAK